MRFRFIFSFMTFAAFVVIPMSLRGQKESPHSGLTVRQQVDSEVLNLSRTVHRQRDLASKFTQIEKTLLATKLIRKKNPRQLTDDEIYLDNLVSSISDIPKYTNFKKESCPEYQRKLVHLWSPKPIIGVEDPALKRALDVLDGLCRDGN